MGKSFIDNCNGALEDESLDIESRWREFVSLSLGSEIGRLGAESEEGFVNNDTTMSIDSLESADLNQSFVYFNQSMLPVAESTSEVNNITHRFLVDRKHSTSWERDGSYGLSEDVTTRKGQENEAVPICHLRTYVEDSLDESSAEKMTREQSIEGVNVTKKLAMKTKRLLESVVASCSGPVIDNVEEKDRKADFSCKQRNTLGHHSRSIEKTISEPKSCDTCTTTYDNALKFIGLLNEKATIEDVISEFERRQKLVPSSSKCQEKFLSVDLIDQSETKNKAIVNKLIMDSFSEQLNNLSISENLETRKERTLETVLKKYPDVLKHFDRNHQQAFLWVEKCLIVEGGFECDELAAIEERIKCQISSNECTKAHLSSCEDEDECLNRDGSPTGFVELDNEDPWIGGTVYDDTEKPFESNYPDWFLSDFSDKHAVNDKYIEPTTSKIHIAGVSPVNLLPSECCLPNEYREGMNCQKISLWDSFNGEQQADLSAINSNASTSEDCSFKSVEDSSGSATRSVDARSGSLTGSVKTKNSTLYLTAPASPNFSENDVEMLRCLACFNFYSSEHIMKKTPYCDSHCVVCRFCCLRNVKKTAIIHDRLTQQLMIRCLSCEQPASKSRSGDGLQSDYKKWIKEEVLPYFTLRQDWQARVAIKKFIKLL